MLATMVDKEKFGILDYLNGNICHSVSLGIDPPPSKPASPPIHPAIFFVPPSTEKLHNKFIPGRLQAQIIPTYCTCLAITFILISEQSTNTS